MEIYVLFNDKERSAPKTFYSMDKEKFSELNSKNWWVYKAVNYFDASEEEMNALAEKKNKKGITKRNKEFLKKLRFVYADLDIAKTWEWISRQEKESRKNILKKALLEKCPPSFIIDTSNWIQPMWKINEESTSQETQKKYRQTIEWIIDRSRDYWWAWDAVKDVTRIMRVPWYYHMKEEPYMVTVSNKTEKEYDLDYLFKAFPKTKVEDVDYKPVNINSPSKQYDEIDRIDFQEIIIRAFSYVGRSASFDRSWRLILDGRLTWTFQWRNKDRRYLASTSHEPFVWNAITAVADIINGSKKDAYARLIDEFDIPSYTEKKAKEKTKEEEKEMKENIKENYQHINSSEKFYLWMNELLSRSPDKILKRWWTKFDWLMWWIYPWRIYLVWADTWVGKSTFVNAVCDNVQKTWNRVVRYSLEDSIEEKAMEEIFYMMNEIRKHEWKKPYHPIRFQNWEYNKDEEFIRNLKDVWVIMWKKKVIDLDMKKPSINVKEMMELFREEIDKWTRLFIIDHLHMFDFWETKERQDIQIHKTIMEMRSLIKNKKISLILIAHYKANIKSHKDSKPSKDRFRGSSSIKQLMNAIIQIQGDPWFWENYRKFYITKLRWLYDKNYSFEIDSYYDSDSWEYDFEKTVEQLTKEDEYASMLD